MNSDSVRTSYRYGPFGTTEAATDLLFENPLRFAGSYRDRETGLYYMRNRFYDAELGRFISEDPIGLAGGINLYAFVGNDPANKRDPFGLCEGATTFTWAESGLGVHYVCKPWNFSTGRREAANANRSGRGDGVTSSAGNATSGASGAASQDSAPSNPSTLQCMAGAFFSTGSTAAGVKEHSNVRGTGANAKWRGANNVWYSVSWGGNGWTGGRNAVQAAGRAAQAAGTAFGVGAIGFSLLNAGVSIYQGESARSHGFDALVSAVSLAGSYPSTT